MVEVKDYCDSMSKELTTWREEIRDVLNVVETFPENDKKLASTQIGTLRVLVDDLSSKIEKLKNECPIGWEPAINEFHRQVAQLREKITSMWDFDHIAGGFVGG